MLIVSIAAMIAYTLVCARCGLFIWKCTDRRQADTTEVAIILMNSILYICAFACLWYFERWKLVNNSVPSIMFVMFTIVSAGYWFRRVGALVDGRQRRHTARREREAHP